MATKNVLFYGASQPLLGARMQREYAPAKNMAQSLMQSGSNMAPVQSWQEGAARALQGGLGGYMNYATMKAMGDREAAQATAMQEALAGGKGTPGLPGIPANGFTGMDPSQAGTPDIPAVPGGMQGVIDAGLATGNKDIIPFLQNAQMQQMQQDYLTQQSELERQRGLTDYETKLKLKQQYPSASGAETWGKSPVWGTNSAGNQVLGVMSSDGNFKEVDTGDFAPQRSGLTSQKIGNEVIWTDALGNLVKRVPIGIAPERTIEDGQVITLPAVPGASEAPAVAAGGIPSAPVQTGPQVEQLPETPEAIAKKEGRRLQKLRAGGTVIQDLQRGLDILENDWSSVSAAASGVAKHIPLTDAKALDGFIQSALSNVGLDTLQTMRENSPTGGALGQVPIQQQKRLEQVLGSLDISQDPAIVKENVKRVINIYKDIAYGTPEEIQALVQQGKIAPDVAAQASDRYELSFDLFGNRKAGGSQSLDQDILNLYAPVK